MLELVSSHIDLTVNFCENKDKKNDLTMLYSPDHKFMEDLSAQMSPIYFESIHYVVNFYSAWIHNDSHFNAMTSELDGIIEKLKKLISKADKHKSEEVVKYCNQNFFEPTV